MRPKTVRDRSVKAAFLAVSLAFHAVALFGAETPPPTIEGIHAPREPDETIRFGAPVDGISLGVWSGSARYRPDQPVNVWISLRTAKPNPAGHSLMSDDPLFRESFLFVTLPDGDVSKVRVGGPIDGAVGWNWSGCVSEKLKNIVRKPGVYKVQWKIGRLKSGVSSFTIAPNFRH